VAVRSASRRCCSYARRDASGPRAAGPVDMGPMRGMSSGGSGQPTPTPREAERRTKRAFRHLDDIVCRRRSSVTSRASSANFFLESGWSSLPPSEIDPACSPAPQRERISYLTANNRARARARRRGRKTGDGRRKTDSTRSASRVVNGYRPHSRSRALHLARSASTHGWPGCRDAQQRTRRHRRPAGGARGHAVGVDGSAGRTVLEHKIDLALHFL
jgi:hypothetical protein